MINDGLEPASPDRIEQSLTLETQRTQRKSKRIFKIYRLQGYRP